MSDKSVNFIVRDEYDNQYQVVKRYKSGGQGTLFRVKNKDNIIIKAKTVKDDAKAPDDGNIILQDETEYENYKKEIQKISSLDHFDYLASPIILLKKPYCGYIMTFMTGMDEIESFMSKKILYGFHKKTNKVSEEEKYNEKDKRICYTNEDKFVDIKTRTIRNDKEYQFLYNYNGGLSKRLKILAKFAKIFAKLADENIVYSDINPKNLFISTYIEDNECWLIDLDNLHFGREHADIIRTPQFCAPEVTNGYPNTIYSDEYSFALLAFRYLTLYAPFEGKMLQDEIDNDDDFDMDDFDQKIDRGEIPWILDLNDKRNICKYPNYITDNISEGLLKLFDRTFNEEGRTKPLSRPNMWEWYDQLVNDYESLIKFNEHYSNDIFSYSIVRDSNKYPTYSLKNYNPFNPDKKVKRYKFDFYNIITIEDEDSGNKKDVEIFEKALFKNYNENIYEISTFDILLKKYDMYIPDMLKIERPSNLIFKDDTNYKLNFPRGTYSYKFLKNNKEISEIDKLDKTTILIYKDNKLFKKINITLEKE